MYLRYKTTQRREIVRLTAELEQILARSAMTEGFLLVSAMHITAVRPIAGMAAAATTRNAMKNARVSRQHFQRYMAAPFEPDAKRFRADPEARCW